MRTALLLVAALGLARSASAEVIWRGDFETGNLRQWSSTLFGRHITVVTSPVRQGRYAARVELHDEDRWSNGLRRVELSYNPPRTGFQNSEHYYAWSIMQSPDLPLSQDHTNQIAYWESHTIYRQVMAFTVSRNRVSFNAWLRKPDGRAAGQLYRGDFSPGRWHDFVLHVKWSPDPNVGFVALWHNGVKVVEKTQVQTMHEQDGVIYHSFLHLGLLHGNFDTTPEAVFVDGAIDATTFADVAHLAVAPDGGVPLPDAAAPRPDAGADAARPPAADAGGAPPDAAGAPSPPVPGDAAPPARDAAVRPPPDAPPADDDVGPFDDAPAASEAGCGCRIGAPGVPAPAAALLALGLLLAWRRRRPRG